MKKHYKNIYLIIFTLFTLPCLAVTSNSAFPTVPPLITFTFNQLESKILPGTSTENATGFNCNSGIKPEDTLGSLALVATFYQNGCYTDGRYNHNNYAVSRGSLADSTGQHSYTAYTINEPTQKASQFLASTHVVFYKFPTVEAYSVYSFNSITNELRKLASIPAASIIAGQFTKIAVLNASAIKGSITYVFAPSSQRISNFSLLAPNVEGALVKSNALADVNKFRYKIAGQPFDTYTGFNFGPNSWDNLYSQARQFFIVYNAAQKIGIIWQNKLDNSIKLTWIGSNSFTTAALTNTRSELLTAATYDGNGNLYYLTAQSGDGSPNTDRTATLYKTTDTGVLVASSNLDTSTAGLNMVEFFKVASLKYANGKLGLMLGRKMHQTPDGLNHQGGIAVVYDANTLAQIINWGQTSGHSFDNVLTSNALNQFISIDLGDNFPRGIHLHRFDDLNKTSSVVYTFKTQHGTTATSPAGVTYPLYSAISTALVNYYQWSNDNNTYTELGGVVENTDGYSVFFAGEPTINGKALNNTRVGSILNDARNIGMVKVISNFPNTGGNAVSSSIMLSTGASEIGGFYNFGGGWSPQRNAGVVWLTHYTNKALTNASRVKTVKIAENKILILWELWKASAYADTFAMTVDSLGTILSPAVSLGSQVRLDRRDDAFVSGNNVYLVSGSKAEGKLELIELKVK